MANSKTLGGMIEKFGSESSNFSNNAIDDNVDSKLKAKVDRFGRAYGTGRRKTSSARVWIKKGTGKIIVNNKDVSDYFTIGRHLAHIKEPLIKLNASEDFDVISFVRGGGRSGQAGAIRHGIGRALDNYAPTVWHATLSKLGFLTRDSRMVESKKYGLRGARKGVQFSKR